MYIVPATEDVPLTEHNCVGIREGVWSDRVATDFVEAFDSAGVELLESTSDADLILMDEIVQGENLATPFQQAVIITPAIKNLNQSSLYGSNAGWSK